MITIDEIMITNLFTLPEDATVYDAKKLMEEKRIRHVPIVSGEVLVGLISQRDLLKASRSSLLNTTLEEVERMERNHCVREIMTRNVKTVDERDSLKSAAIQMRKHQLGCLPVVTDGVLKGIVTDTDFVGIAVHLIEQMEQMDSSADWEDGEDDLDTVSLATMEDDF